MFFVPCAFCEPPSWQIRWMLAWGHASWTTLSAILKSPSGSSSEAMTCPRKGHHSNGDAEKQHRHTNWIGNDKWTKQNWPKNLATKKMSQQDRFPWKFHEISPSKCYILGGVFPVVFPVAPRWRVAPSFQRHPLVKATQRFPSRKHKTSSLPMGKSRKHL